MTQEEKLKEAKKLYETANPGQKYVLERLFPELKESEEEKIREMLIRHITQERGSLSNNEAQIAIDWLEKQGDKDEEILVLKDQIESLHAAIKAIKETHKIELEKQGKQKLVKCNTEWYDFIRWFVKERTNNYTLIPSDANIHTWGDIILEHAKKELEKQGGQKPAEWHREDEQNLNVCLAYISDEFLRRWLKDVIYAKYDEIKPVFRIGNIISNGISEVKIVSIDKNYYIVTNDEIENDANVCNWVIYFKNQDDWKLVEQKSTDKVKPKFKIEKGKWYVGIKTFALRGKLLIKENNIYYARENGAVIGENESLFIDKHDGNASEFLKLWTIQDAKDGDVLVINDKIVIFDSYKTGSATVYCDYNGKFNPCHKAIFEKFIVHPANKEQRDLLFQKMKEEDYEWDAKKKELRKIEKNPDNKVEPRFKVKYAGSEYNVFEVKDIGNITYYGIEDEPNHIDYVKADSCEIISGDNDIKENNFSIPTKPIVFSDKVESNFKDGDVLFTSSTASHETFIFKSIDEKGNVKCYFSYDSEDGFREGKYHFIGSVANCKPATKEQRDLLFQKMKEAGYEWNVENKELRKIL